MRSGKLAFLDELLTDSTLSASVVSAVRRWLYLRRFQRAAAAVVCANRLARRLQGLRLVALFAHVVRLRLRLAQALRPRINRARARLHNARVARKAAERAAQAKEELARVARARMEENTRADQAKQRLIVDAKLGEEVAHAALADRMALIADTLAGYYARMMSAVAAATAAAAERDRTLEALAASEARARTAETKTLTVGESVRGLQLQLRLTQTSAQRDSDTLHAELASVRGQLTAEKTEKEETRVALAAAQQSIAQMAAQVASMEAKNAELAETLQRETATAAQLASTVQAIEVDKAALSAQLVEVVANATRERELMLQSDQEGLRAAALAAAQAEAVAAKLAQATSDNTVLQQKLEAARQAAQETLVQLDSATSREQAQAATNAGLRTRIEELEKQLLQLSDERTQLVNQSFSWHEAQVKVRGCGCCVCVGGGWVGGVAGWVGWLIL
jgi:hypothetical protein